MLGIATLIALALVAATAPAQAAPHRHHPRTSLHITWGPGWGWWGPAWYGPVWSYPRVYPNPAYGNFGALDTDISPERAEVWVDGKRVGLADDFDGYPNFLWLEKGTYDVVFYLPGHRTLARQYSIYPGLVIDVEDRLEKGEAIHPLDLGPRSTERRDARIRSEEEQRLRVERERGEGAERYGADRPRDWEERAAGAAEEGTSLDARSDPGRLRLRILPEDASIYLDGRFLGTASELSRLRAGLIVDPGVHKLEVVRPGHQPEERTIEIESGRELEVDVELDEE
jgi:hypothetical protein